MIDYTIVGANGNTQSHRLYLMGGTHPTGVGDPFAGTTGRLIELSDGNGGPAPAPTWSIWGRNVQNSNSQHALALPDGNVVVSGGGGAGSPANVVTPAECAANFGGPCSPPAPGYMSAINIRNQIHCIEAAPYCEKGAGSVQVVGQMTVPRAGIHGVYHLLHTGETLQSAYDRTALSRVANRMFTPGDQDLGVNSSQIFTPPYLYDSSVPCPTSVGCALAQRPVIYKGPDHIKYGHKFKLHVDDAAAIKMVSMIRTGSATHTLAQDQLYVRIPFKVVKEGKSKGKGKDKDVDQLEVTAPTKPVQAKPGDYMLFIVNQKGVPSMAKHVRLDDAGNYVHMFTKEFPGNKGKGKD
jgi:hypothetical protein